MVAWCGFTKIFLHKLKEMLVLKLSGIQKRILVCIVKIKDSLISLYNNRVIVKIKLYIPLQIIHSDEKDKIRVQNDLRKKVTNVLWYNSPSFKNNNRFIEQNKDKVVHDCQKIRKPESKTATQPLHSIKVSLMWPSISSEVILFYVKLCLFNIHLKFW